MSGEEDITIDEAPYIDLEDIPDYNPRYPPHRPAPGSAHSPPAPAPLPADGPPVRPPPAGALWEVPDSWEVPPHDPSLMGVPARAAPMAVRSRPLIRAGSPPPPLPAAVAARSVLVVPSRPLRVADYPPTPGAGATWGAPASWDVVRRPAPPPAPLRAPPSPPSPSPPPPAAAPSTPPPLPRALPRTPSPVQPRPSAATRARAAIAAIARETATLHALNRFASNRVAASASDAAASAASAAAIASAADPVAAEEVHDEATREYHRGLALARLGGGLFERNGRA